MKKNKKIIVVFVSVAVLAVPLLGYYFGILLPEQKYSKKPVLEKSSTAAKSEKEEFSENSDFTALATPHMFSGSGSMKFSYYDKNRVNWSNYPWFWANVTDEQAKYINENKDSVFSVEGLRNNPDCGYIGDGSCLEDINVNKITAMPNFQVEDMPKFEDYPTTIERFTGSPAKPDFASNSKARLYQTMITDGIKAGPGFAGEYTVIGYGCGTSCMLHTIVNTRTGKIVSYNEIQSSWGINYHANSRLIVVNPPEEIHAIFGSDVPNYCKTDYYYLSKDGTRIIKLSKD